MTTSRRGRGREESKSTSAHGASIVNYRGSYRRLLANSKSAIVAAIELYNKPNVEYRDEIVVVLLINGWELFLKAVVSRAGDSVYYPKRRNEPYRTLSMSDAFQLRVVAEYDPS